MAEPAPDPSPFPLGHVVLAIELRPQTLAGRLTLPQDQAAALTESIAEDLARWLPDLPGRGLAVLGSHFDPVELLRPGWPVHAALRELLRQAPGGRGANSLMAIGSHAGRLPAVLAPDADLVGGPLRLMPVTVADFGPGFEALAARIEAVLLETGMAGAGTALAAQAAFAAEIEHARYLSLHDLLALTAVQYQHAGLEPLWPVIETALLAPRQEQWLDAPGEPPLRYTNGRAWLTEMDMESWKAAGLAAAVSGDDSRLVRAFERFRSRQRQIEAVLAGHGVAVSRVSCAPGEAPRQRLEAAGSD